MSLLLRSKSRQKVRWVIALFCHFFVAGGVASVAESTPFGILGARSMGMGGAFTGMSDDLTSVFWNPAGLGFLSTIQLTLPYGRFVEDRDNTEDSLQIFQDKLFTTFLPQFIRESSDQEMVISGDNNIGLIFGMPGFALSLVERNFASVSPFWTEKAIVITPGDDPINASALNYSGLKTNQYTLSFCYGDRSQGYFIGANAKYVEFKSYQRQQPIVELSKLRAGDIYENAYEGPDHAGSAWSFDAGLIVFLSGLRLGLTARDVNTPSFEMPDGEKVAFTPQYRIGASMPLSAGLSVDVDYDLIPNHLFNSEMEDQTLALGLEMAFGGGWFRLRAGGNKNLAETGSPFHYSVGAGVMFGIFTFDTAASISQEDSIWNWSGMITVNFSG